MNESEHATLLLGAYVLGALELSEAQAVDTHLRGCDRCSEELRELAGVRAVLAALETEDWDEPPRSGELYGAVALPPPDLYERTVAAVAAGSGPDVPGTPRPTLFTVRRLLVAAAAAVILACAGVGLHLAFEGGHHAGSTVSATAGSVHMQVHLAPETTGTALTIRVAGLTTGEHCALVAVSRDGTRHPAGHWVATYAGTATVVGSTDVPASQIRRLVLLGSGGRTLVHIDV